MANAGHLEQFPLNVVGAKGVSSFVGTERIFFTGATGLVGTCYGIPGVTATRVQTGIYKVNFPSSKDINIWPSVNAPTGVFYNVNIEKANAYSGYCYLHIGRPQAGKLISTGSMPTTAMVPHNPVSGTMIDLFMMYTPVTDITAY